MVVPKELFETALDSLQEGIALLDGEGELVFWNRAAEAITGFSSQQLALHSTTTSVEPLFAETRGPALSWTEPGNPRRRTLVHARHRLGQPLDLTARICRLYGYSGEFFGTSVVFHPAPIEGESRSAEEGDGARREQSRAELQQRLRALHAELAQDGTPFGILRIEVDQAQELRTTHGSAASRTMLQNVLRAMAAGLRPAELMCRWNEAELIALSPEGTPEQLAEHARLLAGLGRSTDFRWWGDRIPLTLRIGAAHAEPNETLEQLIDRAGRALETSKETGGNHIALAPGRHACLPS